jgi:signal transduction histidine kinase/ActR/RegA family two-component response regulator
VNISTQFKLAGLGSAIAVVAAGAVLLSASRQVEQELAKNHVAEQALNGVTALRYLTLEYILHHEERSRAQWQLRHTSLSKLLADGSDFPDTRDREALANLRHTSDSIGALFSRIVATHQDRLSGATSVAILDELEARLVGQITNKTQTMITDVFGLSERSRSGVLAAQQRLIVSVAASALVVLLAVGALVFLALRWVVAPLAVLRDGTELVGGGNLDHRLRITSKDELGQLGRAFDDMTEKLQRTTVSRDELASVNQALESEILVRRQAERRAQAQLERLNLLQHITRAIGERQDLDSIFQVVVRSLEDELPVDFACLCLYDPIDHALTVRRVGVKSGPLALDLAMTERSHIDIDKNGLSRCVRGELVYEPDIAEVPFPFPMRLAGGGLRSLVVAPLQVESQVFGVLVAARLAAEAFSSGECEFLLQLSQHVALASHQAQLHGALQQAYEDLRQTQQAVMQQERLRALGQMASGIAHDINNALSPVALYTESLLEREPGLSPRTRDYLETIQRAVEDVSQTVARMREFYRQRETQLVLEPVALNQLVQQVIDLTRARWSDIPMQRGIVVEVRADLGGELPAIMGVESEIREALINLILNAVDAVPNGGAVTLRTRTMTKAEDCTPTAVELTVTDNGIGMDEETRRRCLEPFFTTKGERGTGLGLAMVYGVIQRHSAEVEIESAPGRGTSVHLRFAVPQESKAAAPAPKRGQPAPTRLRLLLIDDDPLLLKSLRDTLEADGHVITVANGGAEGIATFRATCNGNQPFAAVISDLGMPNIDGRRVAAAIKAASPETPVILLTGWGQRLLSEDDIPNHVDRVLSKPPKLREVRDALSECCATAAGADRVGD